MQDYKKSERLFVRTSLKFHKKNDADVIEKLNSVQSKNDYVRQLVRADIDKSKKGTL